MYVLIVEDDPRMRRLLQHVLEDGGHRSCWAANGAGALKLLRSEKPDAMILDINLGPDSMTGWDVAREKLMDPDIRGIPIVVLSGMAPDEIRTGARAASDALSGTTLILGKPVANNTLLKALDLLTQTPKPTGEGDK